MSLTRGSLAMLAVHGTLDLVDKSRHDGLV